MGRHRYGDSSIKARQSETGCKGRAFPIGGFVASQLRPGYWKGPARPEDVLVKTVGRSNRNDPARSPSSSGADSRLTSCPARSQLDAPPAPFLIEWGASNQSPLKFVVEASFYRWTLASFANL